MLAAEVLDYIHPGPIGFFSAAAVGRDRGSVVDFERQVLMVAAYSYVLSAAARLNQRHEIRFARTARPQSRSQLMRARDTPADF